MARGKRPDPGVIYHGQLVRDVLSGRGSEEYEWLRNRGIKNYTIMKWRLGAVREPLTSPDHEQYEGRITIPYLDARGTERGLRYRRIDGKRPKYDGTMQAHIFGVRFAAEPVVYITEGEFDCMVLHQMGYKAVGIPGANVWQPEWRWIFRNADEIVVVPDADGEEPREVDGRLLAAKGGVAFRMKLLAALKGLPAYVRVVTLPDGHDVNSMYLSDRKWLRSLLEGK